MVKSAVLFLIMLSTLSALGVGLLGPIYPIYVVNHFSASFIDVGLLYAVFCSIAAAFKALGGKLADTYGEEKVFLAGVATGATCSLCYMLASNLMHLYLIEFFFGISYALQRPSFLVLMTNISEKGRRGLFFGLSESIFDIAEATAAVLSAIIVSSVGFEPLFFACSACQATAGIFVLKSRATLNL
ncbi:MAG: MFS transporter [Candidatus Bathyarchaeia archaeon]